jgi:hypothetical protein
MNYLFEKVLLVLLSLLYFLVVVPAGACARLFSDTLGLRRDDSAPSYFRMSAAYRQPAATGRQAGVEQFTTRNS